MPSLPTHLQVYEVLGLNASVCREVDELVDVEPPPISEVLPGESSGERLWRNFGYRKGEFPLMCTYVYRRFGPDGVRCLVAHFILDHIENAVGRGFDDEMVLNEIRALVSSYIEECGYARCWGVIGEGEPLLRGVLGLVEGRFNTVVGSIRGEVGLKYTAIDVVVNASSDIISFAIKADLIARGYRGRSGFSVSREVYERYFGRIYTKAKLLLRQRLYEALVNQVIRDTQGLINSLNSVKKRVAERERVTVGDYYAIIKDEGYRSEDFRKLLELIDQCVKEAVSSTIQGVAGEGP